VPALRCTQEPPLVQTFESQAPLHAELQQYDLPLPPETQAPLAHWPGPVQTKPRPPDTQVCVLVSQLGFVPEQAASLQQCAAVPLLPATVQMSTQVGVELQCVGEARQVTGDVPDSW
jgi:hypothetical protein